MRVEVSTLLASSKNISFKRDTQPIEFAQGDSLNEASALCVLLQRMTPWEIWHYYS